MRDITDQFLVLAFGFHLFLRRFLKTPAHLLKIRTELPYLIISSGRHLKIQISLRNLFGSYLQVMNGSYNTFVDPSSQKQAGKNQQQNNGQRHIQEKRFRLHAIQIFYGINPVSSKPEKGCSRKANRNQNQGQECDN